jgi:hypothetical protein
MEFHDKIRMDEFIKSCTWRDDLQEWLDALSHCERWKAAHPDTDIPLRAAVVLQHMVDAYQILRVKIEDTTCHDTPAPPAVTNVLLWMARTGSRHTTRIRLTKEFEP